MLKIIRVSSCEECPYREYDNGRGFCEPFNICLKFNILLDDRLEDGSYPKLNEIHPKCKLDDK